MLSLGRPGLARAQQPLYAGSRLLIQRSEEAADQRHSNVGTGVYNLVCTGDGGGSKGPGGHVQVSGYGPGNNVACHVGEWFSDGSDFFAEVDCFGKGGGTGGGPAPADSKFVLLFIR